MNKKKSSAYLYYIAAVCFFIAALIGDTIAFYPIGACMLILGITNRDKK